MSTLALGGWTRDTVEAGYLWLDGGSMFGSVPKPLWSRTNPPDERNRIRLAMRCMLLRGHGRTVLVDVGLGDKFSDKVRDIDRAEPDPSADRSLGGRRRALRAGACRAQTAAGGGGAVTVRGRRLSSPRGAPDADAGSLGAVPAAGAPR